MRFALVSSAPIPDYAQAVWAALERREHEVELVEGPLAPDGLDACWMRVVPGSLYRQLPGYWQAAQLIEALGTPVLNSLRAHELAANKLIAGDLIRRGGLAHPETWTMADGLEALEQRPMVIKPQFGARSEGVALVRDVKQAVAHAEELGTPCLLQQRIAARRCVRVVATPERALSCYEKRSGSGDLILSIYRGAHRVAVDDHDHEAFAKIGTRVCRLLGGRLMGIDVLEDLSGKLWALEANASFAFDAGDAALVSSFADELERIAGKAGS